MDLFVDLDGVLVDLHNGYIDKIGRTLTASHLLGMSSKEIWEEVDRLHPDFWMTLPKTKEFDLILGYISYLMNDIDIKILSAATITSKDRCIEHKKMWVDINTNIESDNVNICMRHEKKNFASGNILIDDNMKNISEWNSNGGIGIYYENIFKFFDDMKNVVIHNKINNRI